MDAPDDLLVALVDPKMPDTVPDFCLVLVPVLRDYFEDHIQRKGAEPSFWRCMPRPEEIERRRSDLAPLLERLRE